MMRPVMVPFAFLLASACAAVPQTAAEYREHFKGNAKPFGGTAQERTVDRPFQAVVADVRVNADRCFNVVTRHQRRSELGPGQVPGSTTYRSATRTTGAATAEMTIQMDIVAGNQEPPGGYFVVLADVEGVTPSRTRVVVYGPDLSAWSDALGSVITWASGRKRQCPELP